MAGNPAWVKGVSGNPSGRTSASNLLGSVIRNRTKRGVDLVDFALEVWRGRHGATLKDRQWAHEWLANRGFGTAMASADIMVEDPSGGAIDVSKMSDAQIAVLASIEPPVPSPDDAPPVDDDTDDDDPRPH